MSVDHFIPEIWHARALRHRETALVYGQRGVINRDYEGDISDYGDTVRINSIGEIAVSDYVKNSTTVTAEVLDDSQQVLTIDQAKYFAFQLDSVDKRLAQGDFFDAAVARAAYRLALTMDNYISSMYTQIPTSNWTGSDASPKTGYDAADVYEWLVDLKVTLDDNDVPTAGRWAVVPPFLHGYLLKDDRFVKSGTESANARLLNGEVGQAAGFTIMVSTQVPNTTSTKYKVIAGHAGAWSLAESMNMLEAFRSPTQFADVTRGLQLYGGKVVRPNELAILVINSS